MRGTVLLLYLEEVRSFITLEPKQRLKILWNQRAMTGSANKRTIVAGRCTELWKSFR